MMIDKTKIPAANEAVAEAEAEEAEAEAEVVAVVVETEAEAEAKIAGKITIIINENLGLTAMPA